MEKKEPVLDTNQNFNDDVSFAEEQKEASNDVKVKTSFKTKVKNRLNKLSSKQKKFIIAGIISLFIIIVLVFIISLFNNPEPNQAMIESKPSQTKTNKEKGWFSSLFSKDDEKIEIIYPSFDIVRMEKGEIVVAGQAKPGDIVHILDNGREIGTEKADENGQWVFIPKKALPEGNRKLSLFVLNDKGEKIKSKQSAILHVSKKSNNEVAVIMGDNKNSKVLKAPKGQNIGALRISKIDYNEDDDFHVEGVALKSHKVNIYMNNKLVSSVKADDNGNWVLDTEFKLSKSKQVIRADMLNSKGKVIKRVEYKFTPVLIDGENSMVVVKKGDCLWNLALKEYGKGTNYVVIFEANKSQIKNPDLIYVGQVFSIVKKDSEKFVELKNKYIKDNKKKN